MNVFTKRTQKRKQKRLKRKSLETERLKAQHGLQDSTDIIIVEHSNTLTVMIQAAGQIVRFLAATITFITAATIFVGFCLLGLASVCFPGPRKEMVEIGIALITQLREYLPFLNAIFWR